MKVLLSIGHTDFLLPTDAGLSQIVKVLSRACPALDQTYLKPGAVLVEPTPVEIKVRYLGPTTKVEVVADRFAAVREQDSPKPLPLEAPSSILL